MLHEKFKTELKEAMKAKDEVRLAVVRSILSAVTNELVANRKLPTEVMDDAGTLTIIKRLVKQRKDSIEQFERGGRSELAASEKAELAILETYLPAAASRDEIMKIALAKKEALGADPAKKGILVGAIMKEFGGTADGTLVKEVVDELFQ